MAIETRKDYWIYQIVISENEMLELQGYIQNGKAEYVAGLLIGKLKANAKLVVPKTEDSHL